MDEEERARHQRAEERRRTMIGGLARSHDELDEADLRFWMSQDHAMRLRATFELMADLQSLRGIDGAAARLQRSIGGARKARGPVPARGRLRRRSA